MKKSRHRPTAFRPATFFEPLEPRVLLSSPDIVAVSMNLDATGANTPVRNVTPGESIFVEADFSIDATTTFNPPLHVVFLASRDGTFNDARVLNDFKAIDMLNGGSLTRFTTNINIPKNLASGDWHLIAYINPIQSSTNLPIYPEDFNVLYNNAVASTGVIHVVTPADALANGATGAITDKLADSILAGTGGRISVNVTSPLLFPAAAVVSVELFASKGDAIINDGDVPLGAITDKLTTFAANATKPFAFNPLFPANTPAGDYYLVARVTLKDTQGTTLVTFTAAGPDPITVGPPVRDLAGQFDPTVILPSTLVPGDVVKPSLVISDHGNVPVKGVVLINYYASLDTTHADGDGDILIGSVPTKLSVTPTVPQTIKPSLTLPGNLTPGSYHIVAKIDPVIGGNTPGTDANDANNQAATVSENVTWQFGNIPGRAKPVTLTLLDGDGSKGVFSIKGAGLGQVAAGDANGWDLTVTGTAAKTAVAIAVSGGADERIKLRNVTVNAPLDPLATLSLKSLTATAVDFRGAIALKDVGAFTAGSIGSDAAEISLTASSIGALKVLGDFRNTRVLLTAPASPADPTARTIGSLNVAGELNDVQLRSRGNIGKVSADEIIGSLIFAGVTSETDATLPDAANDFNVDASIDSVTVTGPVPTAAAPFGFVNSLVAASHVGTVSVLYPNTANNGVKFGVTTKSLKSLTIKNAVGKTILKPTLSQVVNGDLEIRIV